jgi:hypothetical protein
MTTTDAADVTCTRCTAPWRTGARFCTTCGAQAPSAADTAPLAIPVPRWSGPPSGPWAPPPPEPPRSPTGLIVLACVLALLAAALGGYLVVGRPWSATAGPGPAAAPAPAGTPSAAAGAPADPGQALRTQQQADAAAVEGLVDRWVPQLSAKKAGMTVGGRTYDDAAVLADHRELRGTHPDAVLAWSGDWSSFRGQDFWITVINRPFPSAEAANAWCAQAGIGSDDCYAKRLSRTGGYAENTRLRTDSGSRSGATSEATPVLGDNSWAPGLTGFGTARPSEINANGDGTSVMSGISWDSWGGAEARGRGTAYWVPPDGFQSDAVARPAIVVASDLGECRGHLGYRRVGWYFPTEGETSLPPGNGYEDICDG